jgi:hypothetical protein
MSIVRLTVNDDDYSAGWISDIDLRAHNGNDTIWISGIGNKIYGGAGNDTITFYAYGTTEVRGGTGSNTIVCLGNQGTLTIAGRDDGNTVSVIASAASVTDVITKNGADLVEIHYGDDVTDTASFFISTGSGDDSVTVTGPMRGVINTGHGNDVVKTPLPDPLFVHKEYVHDSNIDLGTGNDRFEGIIRDSTIRAGVGNDTIVLTHAIPDPLMYPDAMPYLSQGNVIVGGRGQDTVDLRDAGPVSLRGANTIVFETVKDSHWQASMADQVLGFATGLDKFDLRGIAAQIGVPSLVWDVGGDGVFSGVKGEVVVTSHHAGGWRVAIDANGDGVFNHRDTHFFVDTYMDLPLSASDFLLG